MTHDQIIETRQALVSQLPVTGEILRGSLLERTVRHARGCATCACGEGHPLSVLTVSYPGGRTTCNQAIDDRRRNVLAEEVGDAIARGRLLDCVRHFARNRSATRPATT